MAEPYRSQLDANPAPLPGASADAFGAAAARGIEDAGGSIDRAIHALKENDRDSQAAAAGLELATVSTDADQAALDAREQAAPGAAGHSAAVLADFDKRRDEALAQIRDKRVREAFAQRYGHLRENLAGREYGWEVVKRADKLASDFDEMGSTLANGQSANPDALGIQVSLQTVETAGRQLNLPADTQGRLIKEQQRKIVVSFANSLVDRNPALIAGDGKTQGLIDRPQFARYLEPEDLARLRDGAHVELRRLAVEDRQKRNQAETAAREKLSLFSKKLGDGYVPSDAEWSEHETLAKTFKLEGQEWDLAVAKGKGDLNRETRDWTPATWRDTVNALEAKGDQRSQAENVRLKLLKEAAPSAIGRFNSDPFAAAAAAGTPAPELDPADPASAERRVTWARSYARSAGLTTVPYLSLDEMKGIRERAAQGPAGQIEVAGELRATFGIAAASEIARQVDPASGDLRLMVGLVPRFAQQYRVGAEALKAKTVTLGAVPEDGEALHAIFQDYAPAIPPEMQPAVLNAARSIAAGMAAEHGMTQPSGDDLEGIFRIALQRAGGMTGAYFDGHGSAGGFVRWGRRFAWMPATMTRDDFARRISRADDGDWLRAGGGPPFYLGPDGKRVKMSDKQIAHLREYELAPGADAQGRTSPGFYLLIDPAGGHIVDANGKPWIFDVRKLVP